MLLESLQKRNAQANESYSLPYFAPKNVNYARSSSLVNCVSINEGIQIEGYLSFFLNIFFQLRLNIFNSSSIYLSKNDEKKGIVRYKRQSREYKQKRKFQSEA